MRRWSSEKITAVNDDKPLCRYATAPLKGSQFRNESKISLASTILPP